MGTLFVLQLWTGKATLGDAMLATLQRLPRLKWMITTLGKRGSVLVERRQGQQHGEEAVLEDELNAMLSNVASSSGRQIDEANAGATDCTSKNNTGIRSVQPPC